MNALIICTLVLICIYLMIYAYIKFTYKFWAFQPVFHVYNLFYWWCPPGVIKIQLPEPNKYTDFETIKCKNELNQQEFEKVSQFIKNFFLEVPNISYDPEINNIKPYFEGHNQACLFSSLKQNDELQGFICSRPLQVSLKNKEFFVNYVDFLCVHKNCRNKGIAPKLIQTQEYFQRHRIKNTQVSLFKKETKLTGIVPLVVYNSYVFNITDWKPSSFIKAPYELIEIHKMDSKNIYTTQLYEFLRESKWRFGCFIMQNYGNIIELVNSNNYKIYALKFRDRFECVYVFRDNSTTYNGNPSLSCIGTINKCKNNYLFISGFSKAIQQFQHKYKYLIIEENSHTGIVLQNILIKHSPLFVSPTAYYFYNYASLPFMKHDVFIIN